MNVFYNRAHLGDTLMIDLEDATGEPTVEKFGDVAVVRMEDRVVGMNVFNASEKLTLETEGPIKLTEEFVAQLEAVLEKEGFTYKFDVDLSPKFVVGHVLTREKHPNADKLSVCTVDVGAEEPLQIVCGAANVDAGQKVVVAKVGAVMPSGLVIKDAELRGVPSTGMICSAKELNLPNGEQQKGILVLEESRQVGEDFFA